MSKILLKQIKSRLEAEKALTEKELLRFAKKDPNLKGDWDTKFPESDGSSGGEALEDQAKRIEEYERLLPVEFVLEKKLENINLALIKIKKTDSYGICEKCKKKIVKERLSAVPEARFCIKCQNQQL